jgi:hypothetical protein
MKKIILSLIMLGALLTTKAEGGNSLPENKPNGIKIYEGIYIGDSPNGNPICEIRQGVCLIVVTPSGAAPYIDIYDGAGNVVETIAESDVSATIDLGNGTYECIIN